MEAAGSSDTVVTTEPHGVAEQNKRVFIYSVIRESKPTISLMTKN
jgi:hypothetical protein